MSKVKLVSDKSWESGIYVQSLAAELGGPLEKACAAI